MRNLVLTLSLLFFVSTANANTDFTAGTLDIINLTNQSGTTNWQLGDDSISGTINLGFSFDFYGETFTSGKGATNGCWTFTGYNNTCQDYTPDPLPQSGMDMTIFPLWGDWIRGNNSKMLYKTFGSTNDTDQYFVLGWYAMKEFNRSSSNTFEMLLYEDTNKIEFRYGDLDITKHDIVIGVQGHATNSSHSMYNANEYISYIHHNECSSGTQHDSNDTNCINVNWNSTSHNTAIENKSLSIILEDALGCTSNPLLVSTCSGYQVAYLAQQCTLNSLYDTACPNYAAALFDAECDDNSQFSPACPGYQVIDSTAYYDDTTDYGYDDNNFEDQYGYDEYGDAYTQDDMWYDEEYDEYLDPNDPCYENNCVDFTDADWYALDQEQFGQEQVDEWYGTDVEFTDEGYINYDAFDETPEEYWAIIDEGMDQFDIEQEEMFNAFTEEDWYDYDIEEFGQEQVDEWYGTEVEFSDEGQMVYEEQYYEEEYLTETYQEEYYEEQTYEEYMEDEAYNELYYEEEYLTESLINDYDLEAEYERQYLLSYNEEAEPVGQETFDTIEELDEWYEDEYEAYEEMYGEETEEEYFTDEVYEEEFEEEFQEEEFFAEETFEEEEFLEEEIAEELLADIEEEFEEIEEIRIADEQEEMMVEETEVVVAGARETKSGMDMEQALNVVASTVQTATNSMSGTTAGTSIQATGNTVASGGVSNSTATAIAASGGGINTSGSPSISAQVVSSAVQTQQILQMSPGSSDFSGGGGSSIGVGSVGSDMGMTSGTSVVSNIGTDSGSSGSFSTETTSVGTEVATVATVTSDSSTEISSSDSEVASTEVEVATVDTSDTSTMTASSSEDTSSSSSDTGSSSSMTITPMPGMDGQPQMAMADVQVQDMQGQIDASVSGVMTASEADEIADQIIAQNIEDQKEQMEQQQVATGEYADESTLIAYLGYNPGFTDYYNQRIEDNQNWYESREIYANVTISDNVPAYYSLAGDNINTLNTMMGQQPILDGGTL